MRELIELEGYIRETASIIRNGETINTYLHGNTLEIDIGDMLNETIAMVVETENRTWNILIHKDRNAIMPSYIPIALAEIEPEIILYARKFDDGTKTPVVETRNVYEIMML